MEVEVERGTFKHSVLSGYLTEDCGIEGGGPRLEESMRSFSLKYSTSVHTKVLSNFVPESAPVG